MGFPGNCAMTCDFTLKDDGCLHIAYSVRSDAPTPAGLAHHSYFNLSGEDDCRGHEVQIFGDHYLPVNDALIPSGDIVAVAGTPFDFQIAKPIGRDLGGDLIYDHNFCLSNGRRGLQDVAIAKSAVSGVEMTVATTEPGLQFYAGHKVATPVPGLQKRASGQSPSVLQEMSTHVAGPPPAGTWHSSVAPHVRSAQVSSTHCPFTQR